MKMKKQFLPVLLLIFVNLPCSASRIVKDELGRTVEIPDQPHRLVCLVPSVVDIVYSLGAGPEVVGISDFTKYPKEALRKPSIGLPLNPSLETIVALHPDLALGSRDLNTVEFAGKLQHLGIPVFMVDPHGIEGIYASILSLGRALNRSADAMLLVTRLRARVNAVRDRVAGKPKLRVFMVIGYDPPTTIGKHTFISQLIEAAGGQSVTDDIRQDWPEVGLETIVSRQPQAILLLRGSAITTQQLQTHPGWERLKAVEEGHVLYLDDRIQYPSPVTFDALQDLAKQFHP